MLLKKDDVVWNKKTNMVGRLAYVDVALNQARCDHDERTAAYSLDDYEPYEGSVQPGCERLEEARPATIPPPPRTKKADK